MYSCAKVRNNFDNTKYFCNKMYFFARICVLYFNPYANSGTCGVPELCGNSALIVRLLCGYCALLCDASAPNGICLTIADNQQLTVAQHFLGVGCRNSGIQRTCGDRSIIDNMRWDVVGVSCMNLHI